MYIYIYIYVYNMPQNCEGTRWTRLSAGSPTQVTTRRSIRLSNPCRLHLKKRSEVQSGDTG